MATSPKAPHRDVNGRIVRIGQRVRFLKASTSLLRGLSPSNKAAVRAAVGGIYRVRGRNAVGMLELTFRDSSGSIHFVWIEPNNVRLVRSATATPGRHLTSRSTTTPPARKRAVVAGERRR